MKKNFCSLLIIATLSFCSLPACGVKYNKIMTQKIRQSLGEDYKTYQAFSYPTNNFGLATSYTPQGESEAIDNRDFLCDMWNCLGVKDEDIPGETAPWLRMNGFAAVGGNGATISLTETEQNDLTLGALLPDIFQVIGLTGKFNRQQVVNTKLQIGRAYPRLLRRSEMENYINALPDSNRLKVAFKSAKLLLIVGDVVIDQMKIVLDVDQTVGAALEAELAGKVGQIFNNGKLEVKLGSTAQGEYTFEVTKPVIVMRLARRSDPTVLKSLTADEEWKDWKRAKVPEPKFNK